MREYAADLLDEISTHDLVQPLTAIKLQAEMLARRLRGGSASDDEVLMTLDAIAERAGTLSDTLAAQLSETNGELDATLLRRAPCDLVAAVQAGIAGFNDDDRARIALEAPSMIDGLWDAERIAQVARNLVGNALKYSPSSSTVRVTLGTRAAVAMIEIADDGIGLSGDELLELFIRGYRSPRVVANGIGGVGLGLSACRAIVEAHGGSISAESDGEGRGARFRVTLPRSVL